MPGSSVLIFATESNFDVVFLSSPLLFRYALHPPSSVTVPKGNRVTFFRPSVAYLFDNGDAGVTKVSPAPASTYTSSPQSSHSVRRYEADYSSDPLPNWGCLIGNRIMIYLA